MRARPFACQPACGLARPEAFGAAMAKDKEREERMAAALRENLRRRKAQSRELGKEEKPKEI